MDMNFIFRSGECSYILNAINGAAEKLSASVLSDAKEKAGAEAVFGDTSRAITAAAKDALAKVLEEKSGAVIASGTPADDVTGFIIYSDGESVAIAWKDFQIAPIAIDYYVNNLDTLTGEGVLYSDVFSIDDYLAEHEKKLYAEKWAALEEAIPEKYREDILREMKLLNSLRTHESAKWLGSLYDPVTGGWYISRSARETEGFGPDIESTFYALSLVGYTGMAEMFDGEDYMEKFTYAYPKDILDKVGKWLYELQDEDGYFYVPQWPKKYIEENGKQIRITRDVGSAKRVLRALGITPKYSDSNSGGGESKSALLTQYESVENFREYLAGLDRELESATDADRAWKFYLWGSYFQSTVNLMNDEMKKMMVEFFNGHQNPKNGVWSENLTYNSTNAIHKICSVYNSIGEPMNYIDEMIDSTLEILNWDVEKNPSSCCAIYNVWSVFPYLYSNIRNSGTGTPEEREARCAEKKALVYAGAAKAINTTYHQIKGHFIEGGEVSVGRNSSYSSVYGCPAALGIMEGDIGGYLLGAYDVEQYVFLALELGDYTIPLFTERDRRVFMKAVRDAKPPVKKPNPNK